MTAVGTAMTLGQFLALPEREPALEYDEGVVTQKVSPKGRHSALQFGVAEQINRRIRSRKLGRAFPELRVTFAGMSRVPDVAVYRWDRIPRDAAGEIVDDFWEPPDIAIEIRSPGQRTGTLLRRLLTFVRAGVRAAVLIEPTRRSVVVVRPAGEPVVLRAGDVIDLDDVIPGLRLDVQALFDELKD